MLFLSEDEKTAWAAFAREICGSRTARPRDYEEKIRQNLVSAFDFYIGTLLAIRGEGERCMEWLGAGALCEEEGLFSSTFLLGFLQRHDGKMIRPAVAFEDPLPFIHFSNVPIMKEARRNLVRQFGHSLPLFDQPIRFMDIGCGDGALTAMVLTHLLETGKVGEFKEILLVDSSPAMIDCARKTVRAAFPDVSVSTENAKIQDCSASIGHRYEIAMSSLAYHHMPVEDKRVHLARLKP